MYEIIYKKKEEKITKNTRNATLKEKKIRPVFGG